MTLVALLLYLATNSMQRSGIFDSCYGAMCVCRNDTKLSPSMGGPMLTFIALSVITAQPAGWSPSERCSWMVTCWLHVAQPIYLMRNAS